MGGRFSHAGVFPVLGQSTKSGLWEIPIWENPLVQNSWGIPRVSFESSNSLREAEDRGVEFLGTPETGGFYH